MKYFLNAGGAALLLILCGCVTKVKEIQLTGDIMVDGPRAIAEGPAKDKVLWEYRVAAGAMRLDDDAEAKKMLDDALLTLDGIYGKDPNAKKARSYFHSESKKTFIGEPYERVMAYYYRGILYWMDGEPDNARACFRTGQLEDSSTNGEYAGDYVLLDYLDGLVSTKLGQDGSDAYKRATNNCKTIQPPPPYNSKANVLFFLEYGPGVRKYATGRYHEELRFLVPPSPVYSAMITVNNQTITVGFYDDLGFQATTRGGRVMDHVLANKAIFQDVTGGVGNAAILGGALTAAASRNSTGQEVGLGVLAAGLILEGVSASTHPAADIRTWDNLPRFLSFAAVQLPPGQYPATVEFRDRNGYTIPNLTKTLTINVTADNRDKIVFVSDRSRTPQTL
jgi:hypothetical protein